MKKLLSVLVPVRDECQKHNDRPLRLISTVLYEGSSGSPSSTPPSKLARLSLKIPFTILPNQYFSLLTKLKHIIPWRNPRIRNDIVHASVLRHPCRFTKQRHLIRPAGHVAADESDVRELGGEGRTAVCVEVADTDVDAGRC